MKKNGTISEPSYRLVLLDLHLNEQCAFCLDDESIILQHFEISLQRSFLTAKFLYGGSSNSKFFGHAPKHTHTVFFDQLNQMS